MSSTMKDDHTQICQVKLRHAKRLLALRDVHSVAIGAKRRNGTIQSKLAITIFTTRKKAPRELSAKEQIPAFLEGIPTDVVEIPRFAFYDQESVPINREKLRPIPGGAEIYMPNSPFSGGLCTLGMYCRSTRSTDDPQALYLLANAHCFPRSDQVIFQPESQEPQDRIAYATRIVNSTLVDGGIAEMMDSSQAKVNEIIGIGEPLGLYAVELSDIGKQVIKSGRTTGVRIGTIAYLHADADDKKDQLIVADLDAAFSDHGDSGSVVLMEEGTHRHYVCALLWGGALNFTVCSPIYPVCDELQIRLITAQS